MILVIDQNHLVGYNDGNYGESILDRESKKWDSVPNLIYNRGKSGQEWPVDPTRPEAF